MENTRFIKAKKALFEKYYSFLNDMQKKAVFSVNGPVLILAGAGSGKTTVLVNRISHIIRFGDGYSSGRTDGSEEEIKELESAIDLPREETGQILQQYAFEPCPPWNVLAITFTNKAAGEIKERLASTLGEDAGLVWAGTFHSVCLRILRKYGDRLGYDQKRLAVYDTDDSKRLVQGIEKDLDLSEKTLPPKTALNYISSCKNRLMTPEDSENELKNGGLSFDFVKRNCVRIYGIYQQRLKDANAVDFDDIIFKTVELLKNDREVREYYQKKFRYVCIDEYQDTNYAQFELASVLSGYHKNVMAVGDDDQSIYKFRGATIENILNFDREFDNTRVIKLEENYRSTSLILGAANSVIRNNKERKSKTLWTGRADGEKVYVRKLDDQSSEARFIADTIVDRSIADGRKYSDFAVLCRTNAQSSFIENVFAKSGIPYRMLCGIRFYERKEVKDIVCYLSVVNNHSDDLRLKRIINEPKRKIGATTVSNVEKIAAAKGCSMFEIIKNAKDYAALSSAANALLSFAGMIERLTEASNELSIAQLTEKVIIDTGYRQMLVDAGESEKDRLENAEQLISNAEEYENNTPDGDLSTYLEEVALISDIDNYDTSADAVTIMTIHSAKGLEFPVVFVPGCEEGLFPSSLSSSEDSEIEEERRLAYVAFTRAKDLLYLTHVRERLIYGQTQYNRVSRFIDEIDGEYIDRPKEKESLFSVFPGYGYGSNGFSYRFGKPASKRVETEKKREKKTEDAPVEKFVVGDRVVHPKFGSGIVLSATDLGAGADTLYEIAFDDSGTKKMMAKFARLKRE